MNDTVTRKQFCASFLAGWAALALPGCGGGGGSYDSSPAPAPPPPPPASTCSNTIDANHGHVLLVDKADLNSTTDRTYGILGTATHSHAVTLTLAHLAMLKAGGTVDVASTSVELHTHAVSVTCV